MIAEFEDDQLSISELSINDYINAEKDLENLENESYKDYLMKYGPRKDLIIDDFYSNEIEKKDLNQLNFWELMLLTLYKVINDNKHEINLLKETLLYLQVEDIEMVQNHQSLQNLIQERKQFKQQYLINKLFIQNNTQFLKIILNNYKFIFVFDSVFKSIDRFFLNDKQLKIRIENLIEALKEKKYKIINYLLNFPLKINILVNYNYEKQFKKKKEYDFYIMIQKDKQVNLKNIVIYYLILNKDKNLVKQLIYDIYQNEDQYQNLLKKLIIFNQTEFAQIVSLGLIYAKQPISDKLLTLSLQHLNFQYIFNMYQINGYEVQKWLNQDQIQQVLIKHLLKVKSLKFEILLFLIKKVTTWENQQSFTIISEIFLRFLKHQSDKSIFFTFANPFKILCLIYEILRQGYHQQIFTRSNIIYCQIQYERFIVKQQLYKTFQINQIRYLDKIQDDKYLMQILQDKDLDERKVIYIIYTNKIIKIIKEAKFQDQIDYLWNGRLSGHFNILKFSTFAQNIFSTEFQLKQNLDDWYFVEGDISKSKEYFVFQQVYWMHNIKMRALFNLSIEFLFICSQINLMLQFSIHSLNKTIILQNQLQDYKDLHGILVDGLVSLSSYIWLSKVCQQISLIFYSRFQKIQIKFQLDLFLNLGIIITIVFQIIYLRIQNQKIQETDDIESIIRNDYIWQIHILLSFFLVSKLIFGLRAAKLFGTFIETLIQVSTNIGNFLIIFFTLMFFFAYFAKIAFYTHPDKYFYQFVRSLYFLTEAMFGQFDITIFNVYRPQFGPIFLITYLLVIPITFINLLVALLTYTYEQSLNRAQSVYYLNLINEIRQYQYDDSVGILIIMPLYNNFLNIFYLILFNFQKDNQLKQLNLKFVQIGYFLIFLVCMLIITIINTIFLPIFYIYNFFIILKKDHNKAFLWLVVGISKMFRQYYADIVNASRYLCIANCYQDEDDETLKVETQKILYESFQLIYKLIQKNKVEYDKFLIFFIKLSQTDDYNDSQFIKEIKKNLADKKSKGLKNILQNNQLKNKFSFADQNQIIWTKQQARQILNDENYFQDPDKILQFLQQIQIKENVPTDIATTEEKNFIYIKNILIILKNYKKNVQHTIAFQVVAQTLKEYNSK